MRVAVGLVALVTAFTATTSIAGAVTLDGARAKALEATKAERSHGGVTLFSLRSPTRARATIRESGFAIKENGVKRAAAGLSHRVAPTVLSDGREPAYFFYLDRGSYQDYAHAGRVLLVGAHTGKVRRSRTLHFAPTIDGKLPVFLRSREGYELPAYHVSSSPYAVRGASRAAAAGLGAFAAEPSLGLRSAGSESLVASSLASEKACTVEIGGRLTSFNTLGSSSGTPVMPVLYYNPASRRTLSSFVTSEAIGKRGCRAVLIAVSGDGSPTSPGAIRTTVTTSGRTVRDFAVTTAMLRSLIGANPSVKFELMIDGPGSGAFIEALKSLSNIVLIATSSTARQTAFRYLPTKRIGTDLTNNPLRMRVDSSFFTTQLFGAAAFAASDAEVVHATAEVAAHRAPSLLAYMIARGFALSRPFDFTADLGATQRLYTTFTATPPGPTNHAPVASPLSITTAEDTPVSFVLPAVDLDLGPLTFTVGSPAHGTLTGTAPNLTYTPAANYNGPDSFTFSVSDGFLISITVTVSITITPVDDPPVTTASGTLAYTENDPATAIAPALTVTDVDSSNLTGATAQITGNYASGEDVLALPSQPGITATFSAATGTLTLSGSATVAAYQAALRAVTYADTSDGPNTGPRTVTFKSRDAGGFGPSATRTITVAAVNDAPTNIALSPASVAENLPSGTTVGSLSDTDPDVGDSAAFTLVAGAGSTDNASFQISGGTLQTNAVFDFETKSSYSIRVRVTDSGGLTFEKQFAIAITDAEDAPTDIVLTNASVAENQPAGTTVGSLSAVDQDAGETYTFTLVAGAGSTDNASFQVSGSTLQTAASFDFETKSSYSVRLAVSDGNGGTFEKQFTITVTDVNDAPTDIALSNATVAENQPAGTVVGNLSSTDQDAGATQTYTLVGGAGSTDNAKFQIVAGVLQTAQSLDFEATPTLSVRIRTTDNGGLFFEKQFTITVTNVNEAPTDILLSNAGVAENQPAGTMVGSLSDVDPDAGDSATFTLVAGAGSTDNASFQISGGTLQTNAVFDFETKSSYSIRVRVTDGGGLFFEKQFTISVTDVEEAPTDIVLTNASVAENLPVNTTVGSLSAVDQDAGETYTFSLVAGAGSTDNASFNISGSSLRTSASFDFETKSSYSVRVRVDDGRGGTFEKAFTITVTDANDAPTDIALSNASVAENQPSGTPVGTLSDTDQDVADTPTFSLVAGAGSTDNASFQIVGTQLRTAASFDFETKNSYSIRVQVSDGHGGTFQKQFTVTVTDANDAPTDIALSPSSVTEGQPSGTTVGTLSATDQDLPGDTFTFTLVAGVGSTDNASFSITGSTLKTAAVLDFNAGPTRSIRVQVSDGHGGTFQKQLTVTVIDVNQNPTDIVLTSSTVAENQPVNTTVGSLSDVDPDVGDTPTFSLVAGAGSTDNASFNISGTSLRTSASFDFETKSSYAIRIGVSDGHGGTFEKQFTITVTDVNDAPTDIALSPSSVAENQPSGTTVGALSATDQDQPGDTFTFTLVGGAGSTDNASFSITGSTLKTAASFDFETKNSYSIRVQVSDGHGGTFEKQFTITIIDVNDAPVAGDDTFDAASSAVGNTALVVNAPGDGPQTVVGPKKSLNANILANDSDVDGPSPLAVVPGTFASHDGGTVVIESDGDFTYTPAAGTSCSDTSDFFDYTVTDGATPTPGTDVGRVNITITGCVWYVNNNAAGDSGTSTAPFDFLFEAQQASAAGDTIYVEDGDNTTTNYADGIALKTNQRLLGEAATLQIGADVLQAATPANRPTITNSQTSAPGTDVVKLASGNTVGGLDIDPNTTGGIAGGNGTAGGSITGGTIDDVDIIDTGTAGTQPGLELDTTSGTFNISDLTIDNSFATGQTSGSVGVRLNNAGSVNFAAAGTISITTKGAKALDAAGTTNLLTSQFDDITVTGSGSGAIRLNGTTGQPVLGDGAGTDLSLQTTSGATAALDIASTNTVSVDSAGTDTISATGGPAMDIRNSNGSSFMFDSASSTNSAGDGINLDTNLTSPVVINAGTIAGAAGIAFDVNGGGAGGGGVVYAGAISDGSGQSVEVTGRDGGGVTFSGNIADSADAGGGIVVSGNSAGTTTFSGASKVLNTGAGNAVALSSNGNPANGHLVSFTNGGLDIDTTSGTGLSASNGTLTVGGTGNSITSGTGTALNVDTAGITAGNLNFDAISSNGAANGIRLSNTGTSGSLVVAGTGGTCTNANTSGCTGGQIRNTTGADNSTTTPTGTGIVLNSTLSPSLTRMWIHDNSNYAIRGTSVSGFTMANSVINGTNGDNGTTPFDDSSVWFDNLTGSASVTSSFVSGGFEDNFRVVNTSGNLNRLTMTSDTIGDNSAAGGNDGVSLESATTAGQLQATVQSSTFTGAGGDLLQYDHNGSGTGDLVLTGDAFSNNHPGIATGGGGLTLTNGGTSGATTMSITGGNTFRDAVGNGLTIAKSTGTSTQTGTFSGNTIGVNGVANSGSAEGDALKLQTLGQGSLNWTVANNTIRGYNNFGVEMEAGGSATAQGGAANATITGNTIDQPGNTAGTLTLPKNGVHLNIGTVPGDTYQACAVIGGPGAAANSLATAGKPGDDGAGNLTGGEDIRLRQRQSTTIRLPGYAGANNADAAVASFVAGNNPTGGPTVAIGENVAGGGGGFTGTGSTCP
jgi:hypothetical protein